MLTAGLRPCGINLSSSQKERCWAHLRVDVNRACHHSVRPDTPAAHPAYARTRDGAYEVDWLSALEGWVEKGETPKTLPARHPAVSQGGPSAPPSTGPAFSRPLCVYPQVARYKGSGDEADAGSFECVVPQPTSNRIVPSSSRATGSRTRAMSTDSGNEDP
jgi:hypothetical protein